MASKQPDSLRLAISKAAEHIEFEFMMVGAAEEARRLAERYRDAGVSEREILAEVVATVMRRRESLTAGLNASEAACPSPAISPEA
jgi:hypothetical protein